MGYRNSQVRFSKPHRNRSIASSNINKEHSPLEKFFASTSQDVKFFHNECSTMNGEAQLKTESMVKENSTKDYILDVKGSVGEVLQSIEKMKQKVDERLKHMENRIRQLENQQGGKTTHYRKNKGVVYVKTSIRKALESQKLSDESFGDVVNRILRDYLENQGKLKK